MDFKKIISIILSLISEDILENCYYKKNMKFEKHTVIKIDLLNRLLLYRFCKIFHYNENIL